ncbi:ICP22 family protein, partial [Slackia exigua]
MDARREARNIKDVAGFVAVMAAGVLAAAIMVVSLAVIALADVDAVPRIASFEAKDPVAALSVKNGTPLDKAGLPDELVAVVKLDKDEDADSFVQATPASKDADQRHYAAPAGADALYAAGDRVVYSCDNDSDEATDPVYRVYGSLGEGEASWFASDKQGAIQGRMVDIPVTWAGDYDANQAGTYVMTASFSGYAYAEARPHATVDVAAAETGGEGADNAKPAPDEPESKEADSEKEKDGKGGEDKAAADTKDGTAEEKDDAKAKDKAEDASPVQTEPATLTADAGDGMKVTVEAPAGTLPCPADELTLSVAPVDDPKAQELVESQADDPADGARRETRLYDVKLTRDGQEVQPAGDVKMTFEGVDAPKGDAELYSLDESAETVERLDAAESGDTSMSAVTQGFPTCAVTWTVDFRFDGGTFSIAGESSVLLSEVFSRLSVGREASDVVSCEFSDPALLSVEREGDDWRLASLAPFSTEERLSCAFPNGDVVEIGVTDAPAGGVAEDYVPGTGEVSGLNVSKATGTAPFDADDSAGNDSSASNDVVRSFDTVFYSVGYTLNLADKYQGLFSGYKKANLYVEATLPLPKEQAAFDLGAMSWLTDAQVTDNGASQTLTGYYALDTGGKAYAVPSTGTMKLAVAVKNMANGTNVNLTEIKCWLDAGKEKTVTPTDTAVSSKANYNVGIKDFTWEVGTADYAAGTIAMNSESTPYHGSIESYGVYVSVVKDAKKGDRGLFVEDEINCEFDLKAYEYYFDGSSYVPLANTVLWDCSLYTEEAQGTQNREMLYMKMGNGNNKYRLPYSRKDIGDRSNSAFDSGTISVEPRGGNTYHVKFSGIKTDGIFPTNAANDDVLDGGQNMIATGVVEVYQPFHWNGATPAGGPGVKRYTDVCTDGTFKINRQTHDDPNAVFQPETVSDNRNFLPINYGGTGDASLYVSLRDNATIHVGDTYSVSVHGNAFPTATYGFVHEDIFVKFDGRVFDVDEGSIQANVGLSDGVPLTNPYFDISVYYVGHDQAGVQWDGLDRMRYYNPSNYAAGGFQLFSSMDELHATLGQDALCCGLYFKIRNIDIAALQRDDLKYGYYNDYETVGAVFDLVAKSNEGFDGPVTHILASSVKYRADGSMVETDYDRSWPNYDVPTGATWVMGSYYYPAAYDGNGNCIRNARYDITADSDSTNWRSGKTVYILGEECRTEQRIANEQNGKSKQTYFVPSGERYADYALRSKVLFGGNYTKTSDVTVTATLDKGLSYIPDTAYLGGTYVQPTDSKHSGSVTGGVKLRDNGTVAGAPTSATTIGSVDMAIEEHADGTTTLTWKLTNVELGKEIPEIHYSTKIGDEANLENDVHDGETLKSVAATYTTDSGVKDEASSTTSLKIIALESATIVDGVMKDGVLHGDEAEFDVDEDIAFTIDYTNDSAQTLDNMEILDVLPYDGDLRGSSFHGDYEVASVTVERLNDAAGNYALDYTEDASVRDHEGDPFGISPAYTSASATVAGRITTLELPAGAAPTMFRFIGTGIGPYAQARITVTLHPTGNKDQDVYENDAGYSTATIPKEVYAVPVKATVRASQAPFSFVKVDRDGAPLAGAAFELYACPAGCDHSLWPLASAASEAAGCWVVSSPFRR